LFRASSAAFDKDFAPLNEASSEKAGNQPDDGLLEESSVLSLQKDHEKHHSFVPRLF
jgi:hypothetical protein